MLRSLPEVVGQSSVFPINILHAETLTRLTYLMHYVWGTKQQAPKFSYMRYSQNVRYLKRQISDFELVQNIVSCGVRWNVAISTLLSRDQKVQTYDETRVIFRKYSTEKNFINMRGSRYSDTSWFWVCVLYLDAFVQQWDLF